MLGKLLLVSVFCLAPIMAMAAAAGAEVFLSDRDIDLLVGTPYGIPEPLDQRRNVLLPDKNLEEATANMIDEDFYINDSFTLPSWEDAEELELDPSAIEGQYLDLSAEYEADEDDYIKEEDLTDEEIINQSENDIKYTNEIIETRSEL